MNGGTLPACEGRSRSERRDDLDAIRRWIARDNRPRAITFTRELVAEIGALAERWSRCPEVGKQGGFSVRRMNYRSYRVLFVVHAGEVNVLHVHHGARLTPDFSA